MSHDHAAAQRAYYARHRDRLLPVRRLQANARRDWDSLGGRASRFAGQSNRRAARWGSEGRLSATEVRTIVGPCAYCGGCARGWDHVVPLSRLGINRPSNLVPCCEACNKAKAHRTADEFAAGLSVERPVD